MRRAEGCAEHEVINIMFIGHAHGVKSDLKRALSDDVMWSGSAIKSLDEVCHVFKAIDSFLDGGCAARSFLLLRGAGLLEGYLFGNDFEPGEQLGPSDWSSDGTLTLVGVDPAELISTAQDLVFEFSGADLENGAESVSVDRNGRSMPSDRIRVESNRIIVSNSIAPGRNRFVVLAKDSFGFNLNTAVVFWAGDNSLTVTVKDENGEPLSSVPVKLIIADDQKIAKTVVSENGIARFSNVPPTTIILAASGPGNTFGMLTTTGDTASQTLVMKGFNPPSEIDNNDFSQGLQGWEVGNAPVGLIPHNEGGGGTPGPGKRKAPPAWDAKEKREESPAGPDLSDAFGGEGERTSSNMDLRLVTSGVGTQSVSRTFRVSPGVTAIKVRYRFITTEVVGGYMGSQFNDSYSIAVREQGSSRARLASGSMNGLGPDAFDANGRTAWYVVELPVVNSKSGEAVVQVEAAVTNVADGQYDSALDLDYVKEEYLSIRVNLTRDGACPNEAITFSIDGDASGTVTWTGGGEPATGTGPEFTTRFGNTAEINVQARQDNGGVIRTGNKVVPMWEASGADWVARFPTSAAVEDLTSPFREGAKIS